MPTHRTLIAAAALLLVATAGFAQTNPAPDGTPGTDAPSTADGQQKQHHHHHRQQQQGDQSTPGTDPSTGK